MNLGNLRDYLIEGLRGKAKDVLHYTNWTEMIIEIGNQVLLIKHARTLKEIKKIAIEELGWDDEELEDLINRIKEER
jgi:hypothetical protein